MRPCVVFTAVPVMSLSGVHAELRVGGDSPESIPDDVPLPSGTTAGGAASTGRAASATGAKPASGTPGEEAPTPDAGGWGPLAAASGALGGAPESSVGPPESNAPSGVCAPGPYDDGAPAQPATTSAMTKETTLDSPQNDGLRMPG